MENSNQRIQNELYPLSDKSNELFRRLIREKEYMQESLEKVQRLFSDQEVGRALISELTQAMREVQCAFCELEQLKGAIIEFTRVLAN
jgi:hypothetical protein